MRYAIDIETRSPHSIKAVGGFHMAIDCNTEILCAVVEAIDGKEVIEWDMLNGSDEAKARIIEIITSKDNEIYAHNGHGFDFPAIETHWGVHIHNTIDTIPLWRPYIKGTMKLQTIAEQYGLSKEDFGKQLIQDFCIPKDEAFTIEPVGQQIDTKGMYRRMSKRTMKEMVKYCHKDVSIIVSLMHLIPSQLDVDLHNINYRINNKGVRIDTNLIDIMLKYLHDYKFDMVTQSGISEHDLLKPGIKLILEPLLGTELPDLTKETLKECLGVNDKADVIIKARLVVSAKPWNKLQNMLKAGITGRIKDFMVLNGAGTGRYASKGAQLHNLSKGRSGVWELLDRVLAGGELEFDDINTLTRTILLPDASKDFFVCDYAQIEARISAWLSDDFKKIQLYKTGKDAYKVMAAKIFGVNVCDVTKEQRQVGKQAILALGYGMGYDTFKERTGELPEDVTIEGIINAFRNEYKQLAGREHDDGGETEDGVKWRQGGVWKQLNKAVSRLIMDESNHEELCGGRIKLDKVMGDMSLELPSGRKLWYRNIRFNFISFGNRRYNTHIRKKGAKKKETVFKLGGVEVFHNALQPIEESMIEEIKEAGFSRSICYGSYKNSIGLYGGGIWENICQAIGADLLNFTLKEAEKVSLPASFHVHDEVIVQVSNEDDCRAIEAIMSDVPSWATGLPVACDGFRVPRYSKEPKPCQSDK